MHSELQKRDYFAQLENKPVAHLCLRIFKTPVLTIYPAIHSTHTGLFILYDHAHFKSPALTLSFTFLISNVFSCFRTTVAEPV